MVTDVTIESLKEKADSTYTLIILAAKRARHLNLGGQELLDEYKGVKPVSKSLEEIQKGKITYRKNSADSIK
ncbi:MAG TPA: DNA-directed RNA polymerase subunit omega [Halanaerobiales bacterium]|nr:DNA-directed RNA polymerase subunit omega [Halanaerobiales bacterium]